MIDQPTLPKAAWHVYTTSDVYGGFATRVCWCWTAHGPRGSVAGVEEPADAAVHKAYAASSLLDNPKREVPRA